MNASSSRRAREKRTALHCTTLSCPELAACCLRPSFCSLLVLGLLSSFHPSLLSCSPAATFLPFQSCLSLATSSASAAFRHPPHRSAYENELSHFPASEAQIIFGRGGFDSSALQFTGRAQGRLCECRGRRRGRVQQFNTHAGGGLKVSGGTRSSRGVQESRSI